MIDARGERAVAVGLQHGDVDVVGVADRLPGERHVGCHLTSLKALSASGPVEGDGGHVSVHLERDRLELGHVVPSVVVVEPLDGIPYYGILFIRAARLGPTAGVLVHR
jgi:hypothetical protein